MDITNVNGTDIDAWYGKLEKKKFRKYKFTPAQFAELLSEITQVVVLDWATDTTMDTMIEDVLHAAAELMPHFTEDRWKGLRMFVDTEGELVVWDDYHVVGHLGG